MSSYDEDLALIPPEHGELIGQAVEAEHLIRKAGFGDQLDIINYLWRLKVQSAKANAPSLLAGRNGDFKNACIGEMVGYLKETPGLSNNRLAELLKLSFENQGIKAPSQSSLLRYARKAKEIDWLDSLVF